MRSTVKGYEARSEVTCTVWLSFLAWETSTPELGNDIIDHQSQFPTIMSNGTALIKAEFVCFTRMIFKERLLIIRFQVSHLDGDDPKCPRR